MSGPGPGFGLSSEQEELRATVERFARLEVAPAIGDYYQRAAFPYPIVEKMGALGLFGLPFPERYGGMGGDLLTFCLAVEELARVDSSVAATLEAAVGLGAMPIYRFGTEEQRASWLPALCRGELLGGFGLTEPGGGTDAGATRTTARLEDGTWVIDGTKAFITNSGTDITGFVIVTAVTGGAAAGPARDDPVGERVAPPGIGSAAPAPAQAPAGGPAREISAILVPAGTPGLFVAPGYSKVGWAASDTHELSLSGCRVPAGNLLGVRGRGYAQFLEILDEGRIAIGALATGLAQGCVDECLAYVEERKAFGRRIGENQAIQFKIADMAVRAHSARLAWRHAAALCLASQRFKKEAAIAKLVGTDAAMANAREASQIFGGYGFMNDTPVGRFYRDAKILEIGEGTSEVQRMLIARELGIGR